MSSNITMSDGWNILKDLYLNIGSQKDLSNEDIAKLLKESDLNKDGKITADEFKKTCQKSSDFNEMAEKYNEIFKMIAKLDSDCSSITDKDIDEALALLEKMENQTTTNSSNSSGLSGSSGSSGSGGSTTSTTSGDTAPTTPTSPSEPADTTTPADTTPQVPLTTDALSSNDVTLTGSESMEDLRAGRSAVINAIESKKQERSTIKSNSEYQNAVEAYNTADGVYNEALAELAQSYENVDNAEENLTEEEKLVVELNTQRDDLEADISTKKGEITTQESEIDAQNQVINGLEVKIASLTEPSQSDFKTTDAEGKIVPDTAAYNRELNIYKAKKAQLEAELSAEESKFDLMEDTLEALEDELAGLEKELPVLDAQIAEALTAVYNAEVAKNGEDSALAQQIKAVQTAQEDANAKKAIIDEVEKNLIDAIDAEIEQLRDNLDTFDDAIDAADARQKAELQYPDNWNVQGGFITDEKGNLLIAQDSDDSSLPSGYEANDDGKIYDKDGNVVGVTHTYVSGDTTVTQTFLFPESIINAPVEETEGADEAAETAASDIKVPAGWTANADGTVTDNSGNVLKPISADEFEAGIQNGTYSYDENTKDILSANGLVILGRAGEIIVDYESDGIEELAISYYLYSEQKI